jgi:single-strand DNA-binding protein
MNKWIGMGRLTRNPDVRYTTTKNNEQMCVARFTLAVDRDGKDAGADFPSCVAFGKTGEFIEKYCKQGTKLLVTGRLQTGSYEKDGKKVYTTDVVVEKAEFCESKKDDTPPAQDDSQGFVDVPDGIENDLPFK